MRIMTEQENKAGHITAAAICQAAFEGIAARCEFPDLERNNETTRDTVLFALEIKQNEQAPWCSACSFCYKGDADLRPSIPFFYSFSCCAFAKRADISLGDSFIPRPNHSSIHPYSP